MRTSCEMFASQVMCASRVWRNTLHHFATKEQYITNSDCAQGSERNIFLKEPPKDDFEEYARKVIDRAYFIVLNKIDELDGTNARLLENYNKNYRKQLDNYLM